MAQARLLGLVCSVHSWRIHRGVHWYAAESVEPIPVQQPPSSSLLHSPPTQCCGRCAFAAVLVPGMLRGLLNLSLFNTYLHFPRCTPLNAAQCCGRCAFAVVLVPGMLHYPLTLSLSNTSLSFLCCAACSSPQCCGHCTAAQADRGAARETCKEGGKGEGL